jgi:hypothetical protein
MLIFLPKGGKTGRKIIIENQLEVTNHDHLGKILTYASGYDASIIIWIVKDVRDEHKQAIDWLNEHTDNNINFFIIKIEAWKIGNSEPAPKFHIISEPNDWAKAIKELFGRTELTDTKLLQLDYWTEFKTFATEKGTKLRLRKVSAQHWYTISIGNAACHISLSANTRDSLINCEIWITDSKEIFKKLFEEKENIEKELSFPLEWLAKPSSKASSIKLSKEADINNRDTWNDCFSWMLTNAEKFHDVFNHYLLIEPIPGEA